MTNAHNQKDVEERLWKEIKKQRYGMLGLVNADQHYQPMTAFAEEENGQLWFFTRDDTDLAKAVTGGQKAMFVLQAKDQDIQACLGGALSQDRDRERIERYWNPMIAAWYPDGKDDPHLTLLRFDLSDAAVWLSEAGPVRMAFEIARANLTKTQPDLGDRAEVNFNQTNI